MREKIEFHLSYVVTQTKGLTEPPATTAIEDPHGGSIKGSPADVCLKNGLCFLGWEENFPDDNIGIIFSDLIYLFYSCNVINRASLPHAECRTLNIRLFCIYFMKLKLKLFQDDFMFFQHIYCVILNLPCIAQSIDYLHRICLIKACRRWRSGHHEM